MQRIFCYPLTPPSSSFQLVKVDWSIPWLYKKMFKNVFHWSLKFVTISWHPHNNVTVTQIWWSRSKYCKCEYFNIHNKWKLTLVLWEDCFIAQFTSNEWDLNNALFCPVKLNATLCFVWKECDVVETFMKIYKINVLCFVHFQSWMCFQISDCSIENIVM